MIFILVLQTFSGWASKARLRTMMRMRNNYDHAYFVVRSRPNNGASFKGCQALIDFCLVSFLEVQILPYHAHMRFNLKSTLLIKKMMKKKKKMENSRVLWTGCSRCDWDVLSVFVARVELAKLSVVPEKEVF